MTETNTGYAYTITLTPEDRAEIARILTSPSADPKVVARAQTLKLLDDGLSAPDISRWAGVSRTSVYAVSQCYRAAGLAAAIHDGRRTGAPRVITDAAIAWIKDLIKGGPRAADVEKPKWTVTALQTHVRENGPAIGFPEVGSISRSCVWKLMQAAKGANEANSASMDVSRPETHVLVWRDVEVAFMEGEDGWRPVFRAGIPDDSIPGGGFLVLPNSPGLPVPEGAVTMRFIGGFTFEQGRMIGVAGCSSN